MLSVIHEIPLVSTVRIIINYAMRYDKIIDCEKLCVGIFSELNWKENIDLTKP